MALELGHLLTEVLSVTVQLPHPYFGVVAILNRRPFKSPELTRYLSSDDVFPVVTEGETGDVVLGVADQVRLLLGLRVVDDDSRARRVCDEPAYRIHRDGA